MTINLDEATLAALTGSTGSQPSETVTSKGGQLPFKALLCCFCICILYKQCVGRLFTMYVS